MGVITFNGTDSTDYGIRVEKCPDYPAAQRKVEFISVEGRSGDLVRDTQAWNNVEQTYSVYFGDPTATFQELSGAVARWLLGSKGYCRLEDDYYPDVYRKAVYSRLIQNRNFLNQKGRADLVFNCKPQRYFKAGEQWQSITSGSSFVNDYMPCYPVFEVTGNGTVEYGDTLITVSNNSGKTLYIDTELQDAYTGILSGEPFSVSYSVATFQWFAAPYSQDVMLPSNFADYSHVYVSYSATGGASGILDIDMSTNFSQKNGDWTVAHTVGDGFVNFSLDGTQTVSPMGQFLSIAGTIASVFNRNSDISISGPMEPFETGSTQIDHTVTALKIQPRTWTL